MADISNVTFDHYEGGGTFEGWLQSALTAVGAPLTPAWQTGMKTLCTRESSLKPNAINTKDANAHGPIVADGHPQNCSRGIAQCIPTTFATYHVAGTSWEIYDPVANIAAALTYIEHRYKVDQDGSNLAQNVQQADPHRKPHGYLVDDDPWRTGQAVPGEGNANTEKRRTPPTK